MASLDSILLGTTNPEALRAWYRKALNPKEGHDGFLVFGNVAVLIDHRTDLAGRAAEGHRQILNFTVPDARAVAAHLDSLGVTWLAELEERNEGMLFATFEDPDGNILQIIQLSPEYLARTRRED